MKKGDADPARPSGENTLEQGAVAKPPATAGGAGLAARAGGGVDRPAVLRDTRFSVHEETADEAVRGVMRRGRTRRIAKL